MNEGNNAYTTSRGVTIGLLPIPFLLDQARASVKFPEPPIYEIVNVAGDIEKHSHDETTLETEEDKAQWTAYVEAKDKAEVKLRENMLRAMLTKGVVIEMPKDDEWVKDQEWCGVQVPAEPRERRMHYILTEVIGRPDDLSNIMIGIGRISGVAEEALATAEDSFRAALGRGEGQATGEHQDAIESPEKQEGLVA